TGIGSDAVFVSGGQLQLTTTWAVGVSFEHWWTPSLSSVIYGGTGQHQYNSTVVNSGAFCNAAVWTGVGAITQVGSCNPGFKYSEIGGGIDWYPVTGLRFAFHGKYVLVGTGFGGETFNFNAKPLGGRPAGTYLTRDEGIFAAVFRAQRYFGGPGGG